MRAIPSGAADFVAAQEDLRLRAYRDGAGVLTLGFGHTEGVRSGSRCSRRQALAWLEGDLLAAHGKLYGVLDEASINALSEDQWTALLSFVFNLGAGKGWTIWKRIRAGQLDKVPGEMVRFVNIGGRSLPGLAARRAREVALWNRTPAPPSAVAAAGKGHGAVLLVSAAGAVTSAAPMVDQARRAIEPFAVHSALVQRLLGVLATVGAALALIGLALIWLRHREAKA
jgi:lysozyme